MIYDIFNNMKKFISLFIIFILILTPSFCFANEFVNENIENVAEIEKANLTLYTQNLILIEEKTGDILYEKNAYEKMYPASTTKILTAILTLENCNLNEIVTVSQSALDAVPRGYTKANLQAGEQFTVQELLYIMLIPSANDAANVLAEYVSGSIPAFANLMNEKAEKIGLTNSHFTNPSGAQDENLYTTAYDLSLLAKYAMNIETFRNIVHTTTYTVPATTIHPAEDRILHTSNLLIDSSNSNYYYEYATGIKTGFTDDAGDCLVASAKKDDIEFIVVCLNGHSLQNGLREKFLDCKTLLDFAIRNYTTYYKKLQEEKVKFSELELRNNNQINLSNDVAILDIIKLISKIIAILIIIIAIKLLFFPKRKRKKRSRKR